MPAPSVCHDPHWGLGTRCLNHFEASARFPFPDEETESQRLAQGCWGFRQVNLNPDPRPAREAYSPGLSMEEHPHPGSVGSFFSPWPVFMGSSLHSLCTVFVPQCGLRTFWNKSRSNPWSPCCAHGGAQCCASSARFGSFSVD